MAAGLCDDFAQRIIPIEVETADEWVRIAAQSPVPPEDGLMAAAATVRGLVLVTRNVSHVGRAAVRVLDPWEPPPAEACG